MTNSELTDEDLKIIGLIKVENILMNLGRLSKTEIKEVKSITRENYVD